MGKSGKTNELKEKEFLISFLSESKIAMCGKNKNDLCRNTFSWTQTKELLIVGFDRMRILIQWQISLAYINILQFLNNNTAFLLLLSSSSISILVYYFFIPPQLEVRYFERKSSVMLIFLFPSFSIKFIINYALSKCSLDCALNWI